MGEFSHTVDGKGRVTIPSRFRDELHETVVVTRGLDGCLSVYTQEAWQIIYEKLLRLPNTKRDVRMYVRMLTSRASECTFDNMGRILLPKVLLEEANIEKNVVVVGAADHVEIWAEDTWRAYYESASESFEANAELLSDFEV